MRIIAGEARGVRLAGPSGREIRPTLDRVREACFSIIGPALPGCRFLDLFAGTGANGLEAISRGVAYADFVDSDRAARALIEENIVRTKLGDRAQVHALTLLGGLSRLPHETPYDFVYADPPHSFTDFAGLLNTLAAEGLIATGGTFILEHATRTAVPAEADTLRRARAAAYGETTLSFYRLVSEVPREQDAA